MTVRQLLTSLDAVELMEWMAFFKLDNRSRQKASQKSEKLSPETLSKKIKLAFKGGKKHGISRPIDG